MLNINLPICCLYVELNLCKMLWGRHNIKGWVQKPWLGVYVMDALELDRTTSVPKSVLCYLLDKVRSIDLETSLSQSCSECKDMFALGPGLLFT